MWVKVFLFISTLLFLFDLHYEDLALVYYFTSFSCICPCDLQCSHYASSAVPPLVNSGFQGFALLYSYLLCPSSDLLDSLLHVVQCSINTTAQRGHPGHHPIILRFSVTYLQPLSISEPISFINISVFNIFVCFIVTCSQAPLRTDILCLSLHSAIL